MLVFLGCVGFSGMCWFFWDVLVFWDARRRRGPRLTVTVAAALRLVLRAAGGAVAARLHQPSATFVEMCETEMEIVEKWD